jgi:SAM-dependent methyltransferase
MQRDANHLIPDGEIGRVAAILRQAVESPSGASARPRVRRSSADKPKARSVARKKFRPDEPIEFQHADAMALPFADASFDAVVCQFGVMFFPEKEKSYHEAYRVLAPGGRYVFGVWDGDYQPVGRIADEVAAQFFPTDPPQFYRVTTSYNKIDPIKDSLSDAGFIDLRIAVLTREKQVADIGAFARCSPSCFRPTM